MPLSTNICYCSSQDCKDPNKIITSVEHQLTSHNSHPTNTVSELRKDMDIDTYPLRHIKVDTNHEELLMFIDREVIKLQKLFTITIKDFGDTLKQFVLDNIVSSKKVYQLYQAVLKNDRDQIYQFQSHLPLLKASPNDLQRQNEIAQQFQAQVQQCFNQINEKIKKLNTVNLQKPSPLFRWSPKYKHASILVDGKIVKSEQGGHNTILMEPQMFINQVKKVQLRFLRSTDVMLHICDLKTIKTKGSDFQNIYQKGYGAYTHYYSGCVYTNEQGSLGVKAFQFGKGDIIELIWNGFDNKFTTYKTSTQEKYEFDVQFSQDAEIFFAVSFNLGNTLEIM